MKILGLTIKKKTWKSFTFIVPLTVILFSYQQCSRSCPVEVNREVGALNALPSCSIDSTVACINDGRSCGEHSDATTWFEDGPDTVAKERMCKYGDKVNDNYIEQVEYVCKDGTTAPTGVTREGPIKAAGQCSATPFNCGAHLDSTKWWETDTALEKVPRTCSDSSVPAFNYYKVEKEYKCENGKTIPTEQKRLTALDKVDNCPGENNCGTHTEGSTWYEPQGTIQSPRACTDINSIKVMDVFIRLKELKCTAGIVTEQAVTLKGDLISYGECPGSVNCGDRKDGETWKEITNDEMIEDFICSDKLTSSVSRFKKVEIKQCTNGLVTVKDTVKGDMLSIGVCPRKGCAPYLDGERWLADLGLETTSSKTCPFGPTDPAPVFTYANLQEAMCSNGTTGPTGYLQRGEQKSETTCFTCSPASKQTCSVSNGSGSQVCKTNGSGFDSCQLEICNSGFYNNNGICTPQVCTPNAKATCDFSSTSVGTKICNSTGAAYGSCTFDTCKTGYAKIVSNGSQKNLCEPIICTPNSVDKISCAGLMPAVSGGIFERQCNSIGTSYNSCVLSCVDGSAPRDGKCTTYSWVATSNWSTCNEDCGGSQNQEFVCKNNFGETVNDSKCTTPKTVNTRICNAKSAPWSDGVEVVSPSTREVCPGLFLGYIEKIYQKPVSYSCVDYKKVKALGSATLSVTNNYCSAIQPARCGHDSLSVAESLKRLDWMKACESKVPAIKIFFEIIGGADQLSTYLNDTSSSLYGKARPRPLYVTFSDKNNKPWIAPKAFSTKDAANCVVPENVKIFGICTSSCYTPDQKLLFSVAGKQQYIPIIDAISQKQESILTLAPESVIEKLKFTTAPIAHFVSELVDTNHKILIFNTNSGGRLSVTFNHPLVASDGVIRDASEFKTGDQLIRADGSFDEIRTIEEMIYPGKVHNVLPYGDTTIGNIIISEGFLSGSAYFQNDGVNFMNQKILRSNLLQGIDLTK
jgi:hypothetical protein